MVHADPLSPPDLCCTLRRTALTTRCASVGAAALSLVLLGAATATAAPTPITAGALLPRGSAVTPAPAQAPAPASPAARTNQDAIPLTALLDAESVLELYALGRSSSLGQGVAPGTSPAVTELPGAENAYQIAFQANTGELIVIGDAGSIRTGQGMAPGTSPSIAADDDGGYQVAFQANTGNLFTFTGRNGGGTPADLQQGMRSGTSPSTSSVPGGGYQTAFQANTGELVLFGSAARVNTRQGLATLTSPSLALTSATQYLVSFQANTGVLYSFSSRVGPRSLGQGMQAGTSPSTSTLGVFGEGFYQTAFQANNGDLISTGDALTLNTGQGMAARTSPSIVPLPDGHYEISFQANPGRLFTFSSVTGPADTGLTMLPGTSPSTG